MSCIAYASSVSLWGGGVARGEVARGEVARGEVAREVVGGVTRGRHVIYRIWS